MLMARILAYIHQSTDREAAQMQIQQFCHHTINEDTEMAHKILGEKYVDQLSLLHNLFIQAVPHDGVEHFLTLDGFKGLLTLIGKK